MKKYLYTDIGRLRLLAFLEGVSLLLLVFIAVPIKYYYDNPALVKAIGPAHGVLFLLFVVNALKISVDYRWKLKTTLMVLVACVVPFGTFYIDSNLLKKMHREQLK
ncbi:DUF3817 domain-containing protein [Fulvivirgaceae bacterium BMA12]|uniref:DUF3817 domain-containing protein n=1 Tax=Agaribacillus aureus TaxID=3051825 RepID=A0ABT8LCR5_9BACT|nr:DUF3817 domain-containing protein [Fulvivirgaceae bacterium BMA12]